MIVFATVGVGFERRWETDVSGIFGVGDLGGLGLGGGLRILWVVYLRRGCLLIVGRGLMSI